MFLLRALIVVFLSVLLNTSIAQSISINENGELPDSSAILDVKSSTQGILVPRMTKVERDNINIPATGLLIFQTTNAIGFYWFNGTGWDLIGEGTNWSTVGNSGTTAGDNFLGTTDAQGLQFKANNKVVMHLTASGQVGVGTTTPKDDFHVVDSTSAANFTLESIDTSVVRIILKNSIHEWQMQVNSGSGNFNIRDINATQNRFTIDTLGNIGINESNPKTSLDLDGSFSRSIGLTDIGDVASINDLAIDLSNSLVRITGPSVFSPSITGMTSGSDGQMLTLINLSSQTITFEHDNTGSSASNRFLLGGSSSISIVQYESINFIYSSSDSRWISID